jgi:hypothetical protein
LERTNWIGEEGIQPTNASFTLVKEYIPTSGHMLAGDETCTLILESDGRCAKGDSNTVPFTVTFNDGIVINSTNLFLLENHLSSGTAPGLIRPIPKPLEAI